MTAVMLTLTTAGAQGAEAESPPETVTVVLVDNQFRPDHLTFQSGKAYQLVLENHGRHMHEFTAPAFLQAATIQDKSQLANGGTDVVLHAGTTVRLSLIAPAKGQYDLSCADHDWDGMVGTITVN